MQWSYLSDSHLIERAKKVNCESSLTELANRHSGLFFKILKKYIKSFSVNNIDVNEIASEKNLVIWNSVKSFNSDKNVKFSTWLANQAKYHCLNALNKKSKDRLVTTGDEILDYLNETEDNSSFENLFEFIENILDQLKDKRIKKIFSMRYSKEEKKPSVQPAQPWYHLPSHFEYITNCWCSLRASEALPLLHVSLAFHY